jgi:hypothetical protein
MLRRRLAMVAFAAAIALSSSVAMLQNAQPAMARPDNDWRGNGYHRHDRDDRRWRHDRDNRSNWDRNGNWNYGNPNNGYWNGNTWIPANWNGWNTSWNNNGWNNNGHRRHHRHHHDRD